MRGRRWLTWVVIGCIGLIVGAVAVLVGVGYAERKVEGGLREILERFGATTDISGLHLGWAGDCHIQQIDITWPERVGLRITVRDLTTQIHIGALFKGAREFSAVVIDSVNLEVIELPDGAYNQLKEVKRRLDLVRSELRPVQQQPSSADGAPGLPVELVVRGGTVQTRHRDGRWETVVESLTGVAKRRADRVWTGNGKFGFGTNRGTVTLEGTSGDRGWLDVKSDTPWTLLDGAVALNHLRVDRSGELTLKNVRLWRTLAGWGNGEAVIGEVTARLSFGEERRVDISYLEIDSGQFTVVSERPIRDLLDHLRRDTDHLPSDSPEPLPTNLTKNMIASFPVQLSPHFELVVQNTAFSITDPLHTWSQGTIGNSSLKRVDGTLQIGVGATFQILDFPPLTVDFSADVDQKTLVPNKLRVDIPKVSLPEWFRRFHLPDWIAVAGNVGLVLNWTRPETSTSFLPAIGDGGTEATVSIDKWVVVHPKISPLPVVIDGWKAVVSGRLPAGKGNATARITATHGGLEGAHANIDVVVDRRFDPPRFDVTLDVPTQDCSALASAIPSGMLPTMAAKLAVTGRFGGKLKVLEFDPGYYPRLRLESEGSLSDCKIESVGPLHDERMQLLKGKFKVEVDEGDGPIGVWVGPRTDGYMSFGDIPELIRSGAILSEDGEFFLHDGISLKLIEGALRLDLAKGRYVYGGSTITQQLVKNLFVGRTKTLARKVEELLIVLKLEQTLRKERILEIYLNCIEYGVKLYGIRNAAHHYFGKEPRELSGVEVAFLMHLKTTPKEAWYLARQGVLPERWRNAVRSRLRKMVERGRITQEEFDLSAPYDPIAMRRGQVISE